MCLAAHRGGLRDGEKPLPYCFHPVEVMLTLYHLAGIRDETVLVAALLHDTVEDTDLVLDEIRAEFGDDVGELVRQVTRVEPDRPEGMSGEDYWLLRTGVFLEEIASMSWGARMIKLADRLSNIREAKRTRIGSKLDRYVRQTVWILQAIPEATHPGLWNAVAGEIGMNVEMIASAERYPVKKVR
jgi:(p)ppGpp synthase/HD superfamily hydrolase